MTGAIGNTGSLCVEKNPSGTLMVEAHGMPVFSATSRVTKPVSGCDTSRSAPRAAANVSS